MTYKQLIKNRFYVRRALMFKIFRIPGIWRWLGEKYIPKVKNAEGSMIPFGDGVQESIEIYESEADEAKEEELYQDMIRAWYKNTMTPEEYCIFGFKNLSQRERDAYVSRKEKDLKMCLHVGIGEDYLLLKDKYKFYCKFHQFFQRDVCLLTDTDAHKENFFKFCKAHSQYIAKNNKGRMGVGTVVRTHDGSDNAIKKEIEFLLTNGQEWVIEELIEQDERMARLNPTSVNTLRICSRWNSDGFSIFETFVRMGRAGSAIDNVSSGGIAAAVDPITGIIKSEGFGKGTEKYSSHPDSKIDLIGFQIPEWDDLLEEVYQIHSLIDYYPYVGWDFALSTKGWVVIEGNWGYFLTQYLRIGMRKEFEKCFR